MLDTTELQLNSDRLILRTAVEEDLPQLLGIHSDDEVTQYLPYTTWTGIEDARAWFDKTTQRHLDGTAVQFVVCDKSTSRVVGTCMLFGFDPGNSRAEIGYALGRAFWGKGYMQEALTALVGFSFNDLALGRLDAEVDPENIASHKLLLRTGFKHQGCLRQYKVIDGEPRDVNFYTLLNRERGM